jgi:hypothetical protein
MKVNPEDSGSKLHQNVDNKLPTDTTSYPRGLQSSYFNSIQYRAIIMKFLIMYPV